MRGKGKTDLYFKDSGSTIHGKRREEMNTAIKAALLSAFLFPGSGQLYLKRYWRGLLMMMLTMMGLAIILVRSTVVALNRLKAIQGEGNSIDISSIFHLAETSSANAVIGNTAILVFLVACWIFSVIDAYRIGKKHLPGIS
jgi:TM2 domain-containing membrane protein YozV